MLKSNLFIPVVAIGVAIILLLSFSIFHIVPSGHKGVYVLFGKVEDIVLEEGLHLKNPLAEVVDIDVRKQKINFDTEVYTQDVQRAELKVVVTYSLKGSNVAKLYREVGASYEEKIITPLIITALKDIVGKWEADNFIAHREEAAKNINEAINNMIDAKFVTMGRFNLVNISYSDEFEKAIEEKQIATQNAIKAKNDTVRVSEIAKQKIISAEAEATSMKIKSKALATNRGLIEYEAVQKWDGKLPTTTSGVIPFLKLGTK